MMKWMSDRRLRDAENAAATATPKTVGPYLIRRKPHAKTRRARRVLLFTLFGSPQLSSRGKWEGQVLTKDINY